MANTVYAILIIFSGFSVGCGVVGAVVSWQLAKMGATMAKHTVALLVGVILTQGVLLVRLIQIGTIDELNVATWAYIVGLVVQSYGLLATTSFALGRYAEYEVKNNVNGNRKGNEL